MWSSQHGQGVLPEVMDNKDQEIMIMNIYKIKGRWKNKSKINNQKKALIARQPTASITS